MDLSAALELDGRCLMSRDALDGSASFGLCWVAFVGVAVTDEDLFAGLLFEAAELPFLLALASSVVGDESFCLDVGFFSDEDEVLESLFLCPG